MVYIRGKHEVPSHDNTCCHILLWLLYPTAVFHFRLKLLKADMNHYDTDDRRTRGTKYLIHLTFNHVYLTWQMLPLYASTPLCILPSMFKNTLQKTRSYSPQKPQSDIYCKIQDIISLWGQKCFVTLLDRISCAS